MPDYSSYSMNAIERMYEAVCKAYTELECPGYMPCFECCVAIDCKRLRDVSNNIYKEMRKRILMGVSHGEEKDRP